MPNFVYDRCKTGLWLGQFNWVNDDVRAMLVDLNDYFPDSNQHQFLSNVPAAARVATVALSGKTVTNGVLDANDPTFAAVTGDVSEALLLYQHTGSDATARLIALLDQVTGLPVTPNGGDIELHFSDGPSRIMRIA